MAFRLAQPRAVWAHMASSVGPIHVVNVKEAGVQEVLFPGPEVEG